MHRCVIELLLEIIIIRFDTQMIEIEVDLIENLIFHIPYNENHAVKIVLTVTATSSSTKMSAE